MTLNIFVFWMCFFSTLIDVAVCAFTNTSPSWVGVLSTDALVLMGYYQLTYLDKDAV